MRILFVSFSNSIHVARWINQISNQGWDIHLFPSGEHEIHPELKALTVHDFKNRPAHLNKRVKLAGAWPVPMLPNRLHRFLERVIHKMHYESLKTDRLKSLTHVIRVLERLKGTTPFERFGENRAKRLVKVIRKLKPDIVHSQEIQHSGYLTLEAQKQLGRSFPKWIVTNWGSDIYYFGRIAEHAQKIRSVLKACDYYSCECHRDVKIGRDFGFNGKLLPVLPNTGGFDLEHALQFRHPGLTSTRRLILLKGYQGWVYRALMGLKAIELCADVLKNYRVAIYLASPEVIKASAKVSKSTGIPIDIIPYSPHEEMLRLHGRARISIGLSISDAISTSFLEAFVMGSFPIQSDTGCADEWVCDGETGILVPPEEPKKIAAAIRRAATDDGLVNQAAEKNARLTAERLDSRIIQAKVIQMYERVRADSK